MIPLFYISIVSFAVFALAILWRMVQIRVGGVNTSHVASVREVFQPILTKISTWFKVHGKQWGKSISYHVLVFGREIILFFKYIIHRLEKKFSKTIDLVKGKGVHHDKPSNSSFLNELKSHQDQMRGTMGVK